MKHLTAGFAALILCLSNVPASAQTAEGSRPALLQRIDDLARSPGNRADVERVFGVRLRAVEVNRLRNDYEFGRVVVDESIVKSLDFRSPGPENTAGIHSILVIEVDGVCLRRGDVEPLYALRRGLNTLDIDYQNHKEAWGTLSFGFLHSTDCLTRVSFTRFT